jgi:hypothetical protein
MSIARNAFALGAAALLLVVGEWGFWRLGLGVWFVLIGALGPIVYAALALVLFPNRYGVLALFISAGLVGLAAMLSRTAGNPAVAQGFGVIAALFVVAAVLPLLPKGSD